jgi:hypothetical protein
MVLPPSDYKYLTLLKLSPFERHHRDGWRFGTRRIADSVVERLTASGRAASDNARVWLVQSKPAE